MLLRFPFRRGRDVPPVSGKPPRITAMPVYDYTALNAKGRKVTGIIDADSPVVARQRLRESRIYPVTIREVSAGEASREKHTPESLRVFSRVRPVEISMMTRQLATLVGAGFPLVSAMDVLIPQTKAPALKKVLAQVRESVVEGADFATALSSYPRLFSPLYVNMVRAGETSGTLEIVLERLAEISERQQELKTRIRAALAYPLFMSLIGIVVLFLLMIFIVPNITSIFTDMHQTLPAPTRMLIAVSAFFKRYWWLMALAVVAAAVVLRRLKKTPRGEYIYHRTILRLPVIGLLVRKLAVARFARTLGSLLENGVPLLNSLDIVKNITGNRLIAEAIEAAAVEVGRGQPLARSLEPGDTFPDLSIQMIQVGEQSGNLEQMLKKIADVYETEVASRVLAMTSLLEPVMILVMGVVVGFIVLSICLPIFEMNQLVK